MATTENTEQDRFSTAGKRPKISLDTWAVLVALLAALLIRAGVLKHIPW
jgi:hypothetical protein